MSHLSHNAVQLAPKGSTGTGRFAAHGLDDAPMLGVEIVLETVGGTPAFTFTIQGLKIGGDEATATDWEDLAVVQANSVTAATATPSVTLSAGRYTFYVDGLDKRFFDSIALNVTANTNVTFRANVHPG